jgi:hypothetical protein
MLNDEQIYQMVVKIDKNLLFGILHNVRIHLIWMFLDKKHLGRTQRIEASHCNVVV